MEIHRIWIDNQWLEYDLIYKNIKSLYMKVEQGRLVVKAPLLTPLNFIENNIIKYQNRIIKQINQFQPYALYQDHGYVMIFHKQYSLVVRDLQKRQCQIHNDSLYVYHHDIEKTVEKFLKQKLLDYLEERIIYYLATSFDLDMPHIEVKKYKGRWGSCYYKEQRVSFHLSLIHLEKNLIDYVIVHELTHFLQPNHSKQFYLEIEKRMPDYKTRQQRLKEKHI